MIKIILPGDFIVFADRDKGLDSSYKMSFCFRALFMRISASTIQKSA